MAQLSLNFLQVYFRNAPHKHNFTSEALKIA